MIKKSLTVFIVLLCIVLCFSVSASAEGFFISEFKNLPNLSGTPEPLTIVSVNAILQGEEIQMSVEESLIGNVKWSSSNPDIISCSKTGKIKGLLQGKVTITAETQNGRSKDSVTVYCAKKTQRIRANQTLFSAFLAVQNAPIS